MRSLKHILVYALWTLLSLLVGIVYMRIVLGPNDTSEEGLWFLLHIFFDVGLIYVGMWVGGSIAVLFVLMDIIYLRKKLNNNSKKTAIRLSMLSAISALVFMIHYLLEKVIDVI